MKNKKEKKLKKSLGQNFLINELISQEIVDSISYTKDYFILEIGPGRGALTRFLFDKSFCEYHIVELDNRWAKFIKEEYANKKKDIIVFNENILDHQINTQAMYDIIGNIPYNITYPILEKILTWYQNINSVVFMVQDEVALKLVKNGGKDFGPISVLMQLFFDMQLGQKIGPEEFYPIPAVNSRIIIFHKKDNMIQIQDIPLFKKFLKYIFGCPRKKIRNQNMPIEIKNNMPHEVLEMRAQEMNSDQIYKLFENLKNII